MPADHGRFRLYRAIDWTALAAELAASDDRGLGRPRYPAAVLLRMLVLEQFADLSDREVPERVGDNRLDRAFVGLGADEAVPDDTRLVKFHARLGAEGIRQVFEALNAQWAAAGLIGDGRRVHGGLHQRAKVARRSWVALLRKGRAVLVDAVAQAYPARAAALRAEYVPPPGDPEPRGRKRCGSRASGRPSCSPRWPRSRTSRCGARAAQVRTLLAGEGAHVVSFEDPDARWGHKAPDKPCCGYKAPETLDPDSRLITAVDVVPGNANEAVRMEALRARETVPLAQGAVVVADGLYNNATTVQQLDQAQARPCFGAWRPSALATASRTTRAPTNGPVPRASARSARSGSTTATCTTSR